MIKFFVVDSLALFREGPPLSIMLDEIAQQPEALERTLRAEAKNIRRVIGSLFKKDLGMIVLVARGTSDNAALFARYLLEITTGIPVSHSAPSIHTLYRRRLNLKNALVIGISQSGESLDINIALESCKKSGARVLAVTNEKDSTMAGIAHETFVTRAGKEKSVAATKTYTTQLLILYMIAEVLRGRDLDPLRRIPDLAQKSLGLASRIGSMVERFRFMDHCAVVGRGLNYANAYELSMKLMETCYIVAERFSSADFLHGPIAMVQRDFPVFLLVPPGPTFRDLAALALKLRSLQAETVVISSEQSVLRHASNAIKIPERISDLYSPIPYIIPGQLFAAKLAEVKGLSPDRPRGLSKITRTI